MPYARKTYKPRKYAPKSTTYRKPRASSMRRIAQSVVNRNVETKREISSIAINDSLTHNTPRLIASNLMITTQGTNSNSTTSTRIGNRINPSGVKLYIHVHSDQADTATLLINGDISIKVWVLKQHHSMINTSGDFLRTIVTNNTMNPVDSRRASTLKTLTFKLKNLYSTWNAAPSVDIVPPFKTLTVWIPLGKYKQYQYQDNTSNHGKYFDICMHAMAYSAHPLAITGTSSLARMDVSSEIFFKDP